MFIASKKTSVHLTYLVYVSSKVLTYLWIYRPSVATRQRIAFVGVGPLYSFLVLIYVHSLYFNRSCFLLAESIHKATIMAKSLWTDVQFCYFFSLIIVSHPVVCRKGSLPTPPPTMLKPGLFRIEESFP